ncbi:MAG: hypothetical protein ACI4DS_02475 [Eubacterium sp.]
MAIEVFTLVIVITISCLLFSSIISAHTQTAQARSYYGIVVDRLEDSNFNSIVFEECGQEAKDRGYELEIKDLTVYDEHPSYYIIMNYEISIPVFELFGNQVRKKAVIEGYAR